MRFWARGAYCADLSRLSDHVLREQVDATQPTCVTMGLKTPLPGRQDTRRFRFCAAPHYVKRAIGLPCIDRTSLSLISPQIISTPHNVVG
jgi:hypothetical protein